jgi:hypothetical protein
MVTLLNGILKIAPLLLWFVLCGIGGFWITRALFRLRSNEELLIGFTIGLLTSTFLINFLGRFLSFPTACWFSGGLILIGGYLLNFPKTREDFLGLFQVKVNIWIWMVLILLIAVFWGIGGGMGLLDEYPVLPLISQMAGGDLPPHFALDPKIVYNYHYFSFLFAAQLMHLGDLFPWAGLDLQQAIFLALCMTLLGLWVYRITRNKFAGISAAVFYFFSGGTRWLMLFLPNTVIDLFDRSIERMGSGLSSGATLQTALSGSWAARGTGPYLIPFSFANGFNGSISIGLGYISNISLLFLLIFLLTFNRLKDWKSIIIYVVLLASMELANEVIFVMFLLGFFLMLAIYVFKNRTLKLPSELFYLLAAFFIAGLITLFQGGVISGVFEEWISRTSTVPGLGSSFHNVSFFFSFPPGFVDAHLGRLSFFNPIQLLILLIEIGPMIFLLWPILIWGKRALRSERWLEATLVGMIVVSLGLAFIMMSFKSTSIGSLARAQNTFLLIIRIFAVPFLFFWLPKRTDAVKMITAFLVSITMLGGIAIFSLEMISLQKQILSTYIEPLDARIMKEFWNKLDETYWVLDPEPIRDAVIFGRPTDAAITWFEFKPKYLELVNNPDPYGMQKAGYGYLYSDGNYLKSLPPSVGKRLESACVKILADYKDDFGGKRILLDVRSCQ